VAREIDFAKGARVTVLPVQIRAGYDIKPVMERFDLTTVQYLRILNGTEDELKTIVKALEELQGRTAESQKRWLEDLNRERAATPYKDNHASNKEFAIYCVENPACQVCIAAGDMFEMPGIDVYVNSENAYMQMARIFESKAVSSLLRFHGSKLDEAGRIDEDTIQDELNQIIREGKIRTLPVETGVVIATSAGHVSSTLRKRLKARYIFHTATVVVEGDGIDKKLQCRLLDSGIQHCVRKTLEKIAEVDDKQGIVSPKGAERWQEQDQTAVLYKPIKSIILPIFGTGHGGRPVHEVLPAIIRGIKEFLLDVAQDEQKKKAFHLERIYITAYLDEDVKYVKETLDKEALDNDKKFFQPQS
jgi:O-acetyl-ADP-ribose deacetylase (regulator of RNase III)